MTNILTIDDITIRTDDEGRYCLNDLHKAAGGEPKHQPAFFMKRPETVELIAALSNSSAQQNYMPVFSKAGRCGGTFVVKQMVYSYAMWISAEFQLKVIGAYDTLQTQGIAVADHAADDILRNPLVYLQRAVNQAIELQAERDRALAAEAVAVSERDVAVSERNGMATTIGKFEHTIARVVRMMAGVNSMATKADLCREGFLYKQGGHYRVYAKHQALFTEKFDEDTGRASIYCTPEGKAELGRLYVQGKLTMKKGYKFQEVA